MSDQVGDQVGDGPPDIVVDYPAGWAQVSADDDIAGWAPAAADQLWASSGQPYSALDVQVLGAQLEIMARSAFVVPCFGAFVFCPELARGPRAVFRLSGLRFPRGTPDDRIVDDILLPGGQQLVEPQVEHLSGPGLRRFRVRQRAWTEESRALSDFIAYVFPFESGGWVLSTSLPDPREAERWLPHFDELAAGVQWQEVP
ncbi:hypothetical protein [Blastococcus haudaquaticus]|uniref:hypothetical protein n=1 Tax=Blastococcus haudaquaticus TaxID=1938745 RepID=UPI000BE37CFF|nr:hypothetical protein [Blastococcus haudaquaticus]